MGAAVSHIVRVPIDMDEALFERALRFTRRQLARTDADHSAWLKVERMLLAQLEKPEPRRLINLTMVLEACAASREKATAFLREAAEGSAE